jgi:hypothetical protein
MAYGFFAHFISEEADPEGFYNEPCFRAMTLA